MMTFVSLLGVCLSLPTYMMTIVLLRVVNSIISSFMTMVKTGMMINYNIQDIMLLMNDASFDIPYVKVRSAIVHIYYCFV